MGDDIEERLLQLPVLTELQPQAKLSSPKTLGLGLSGGCGSSESLASHTHRRKISDFESEILAWCPLTQLAYIQFSLMNMHAVKFGDCSQHQAAFFIPRGTKSASLIRTAFVDIHTV